MSKDEHKKKRCPPVGRVNFEMKDEIKVVTGMVLSNELNQNTLQATIILHARRDGE